MKIPVHIYARTGSGENGFLEPNRLQTIPKSMRRWIPVSYSAVQLTTFRLLFCFRGEHNTNVAAALAVSRWKRLNNRYGTLGMRKLFFSLALLISERVASFITFIFGAPRPPP